MKDKGHFITSIAKSMVRIFGYGIVMLSPSRPAIVIGMAALIVAEALGILEEVVDKR